MRLLSLRQNATTKNTTSLYDYMDYIYPNSEIEEDCMIPQEIQEKRCLDNNIEYSFHRYKPDIRIESESLIVEFEGIQHFQNVTTMISDCVRTDYLESIGYKVVQIPFYIQLTADMIKFYFDKDVEYGSEIKSGFYSLTEDESKLNPNCPANFCTLGYLRFIREFEKYPKSTQEEIINSLKNQQMHNIGVTVLPDLISMDEMLIESRRFLDDKHMFHPFTSWNKYEPDDLYEIHENGTIEHWT